MGVSPIGILEDVCLLPHEFRPHIIHYSQLFAFRRFPIWRLFSLAMRRAPERYMQSCDVFCQNLSKCVM